MLKNPMPGNGSGLPAVTRRALLMTAPALAAAPTLAAATLPPVAVETPVLQLYRQIQAMTAAMDDRATSQEEFDRLYAEQTALEWRLTREPVTCAADVAAKVLQLTSIRDDYGTIFEPELKAELEALAGA